MKHLCILLLLSVFCYQLVGVYPVAMWQQHQLRRTAENRRRAALPDKALVRIAVPQAGAAQVQWQEKHEFLYRGQLYDVVRQRATADSVVYFCWHDRSEEKLLAGLSRHAREYAYPTAGARKSAKKAFDYLFKLSFLLPTQGLLPGWVAEPVTPAYASYAVAWTSLLPPVPFAPPRPGVVSAA